MAHAQWAPVCPKCDGFDTMVFQAPPQPDVDWVEEVDGQKETAPALEGSKGEEQPPKQIENQSSGQSAEKQPEAAPAA